MTESVLLNRVVLHLGISKNISCCKVFCMITNGTMVSEYLNFENLELKTIRKVTQFFKVPNRKKSNIHIFKLKNHSYAQSVTKSSHF